MAEFDKAAMSPRNFQILLQIMDNLYTYSACIANPNPNPVLQTQSGLQPHGKLNYKCIHSHTTEDGSDMAKAEEAGSCTHNRETASGLTVLNSAKRTPAEFCFRGRETSGCYDGSQGKEIFILLSIGVNYFN